MSCQIVSWDEIEMLVKTLCDKISQLNRSFSNIVTISRGGLVPSRLIADNLDIEKIFVDSKEITSSSLFVDDIFDSGKTFNHIVSVVDDPSKFVFATLFARCGKTLPKQLVYAKKTNDDSYVVFPWDKLEFQRTQK